MNLYDGPAACSEPLKWQSISKDFAIAVFHMICVSKYQIRRELYLCQGSMPLKIGF